MFFTRLSLLITLGTLGIAPLAMAETIEVMHAGKSVNVKKSTEILPLSMGRGVSTVGETEVLGFMENSLRKGTGLILDSRSPDRFAALTIPGAVNIPGVILERGLGSPHVTSLVKLLGATKQGSAWNFSNVRALLLFGDGPRSKDSFSSISKLLEMGYPGAKILWYRGGLSAWRNLQLTTVSQSGTVTASPTARTNTQATSGAVATPDTANITPDASTATTLPATVIVGSNESLFNVAQRVYGDGNRFLDLYNANRDSIKDINVVHEGQELIIPRP